MTATEILSAIRKLLDVWVDLQIGGFLYLARQVWAVSERLFEEFRLTLINERRAKEGLPPID